MAYVSSFNIVNFINLHGDLKIRVFVFDEWIVLF